MNVNVRMNLWMNRIFNEERMNRILDEWTWMREWIYCEECNFEWMKEFINEHNFEWMNVKWEWIY